jgi:DNA-directed RNA polymerase specialized sigma24 family protein
MSDWVYFTECDTYDYYVRPGLSRKSGSSVVGWILCSRKFEAVSESNDWFGSTLTLYEADSFRSRIRSLGKKVYTLPMAEGQSINSDRTGDWDAIWDHDETIINAIFECLCRDAGFLPDEVDSSEEELQPLLREIDQLPERDRLLQELCYVLDSSEEELEPLLREIDQLPERDRLLLELYYVEELNLAAIGEVFGVSMAWVNLRLKSVIEILRQKLNNKI